MSAPGTTRLYNKIRLGNAEANVTHKSAKASLWQQFPAARVYTTRTDATTCGNCCLVVRDADCKKHTTPDANSFYVEPSAGRRA
jgi:hypothetical protein